MFDSTCDPIELQNRKLYCLLYADDIVLLSESENGLQTCIDKLEYFSKKWNLSVNFDKLNVLILIRQVDWSKISTTVLKTLLLQENIKTFYSNYQGCSHTL